MKNRNLVYLGHMLDQARLAVEKTKGISRDQFDADENLRLALAHLLQTIGEAARRVDRQFQDQCPHIPWREIIGLRHKVVHDYMHVDFDVVWHTATSDLPPLLAELQSLVPD